MALGYTQLCQESADIGVVAGLPQLVNPAGTDAEVLDLQDKALFLPLDGKRVKKAVGYTDRRPLKIQKCRDGVMLYLSEVPTDIDKVIELHLEE